MYERKLLVPPDYLKTRYHLPHFYPRNLYISMGYTIEKQEYFIFL